MSEIIQVSAVPLLHILIALGLINVWLLRFSRKTKYRGANAQNMKEEFAAYGLPVWFMYVVGFLKILIAGAMLVSVFVPRLMFVLGVPALVLLIALMLGAVSMHIKIKDSVVKTMPAMVMLSMSMLALYLHSVLR